VFQCTLVFFKPKTIYDILAIEDWMCSDARWQNFLNLKRLWNGGKKAAVKVGEHFIESNSWGKGAIAFLEGVSEDVK